LSLEQLAIFAIIVFAIMAFAALINTIRSFKRSKKQAKLFRVRRLIGAKDSARAVAHSVVCEIAQLHPEEVEKSRELDVLTSPLEEALQEARAYYLGRVESRHRALFTQAVDRFIFGKE
jgi:biopolymer transport protein ExbB/TolQ